MPDVIYGVTWNNQNVLNYTYDNLGRLTNKTIPLYSEEAVSESLNTTYTYYDVNDSKTTTLLKSISTNGITQTYEYDELGNITSIFYGADYDTFEYDNLNQLIRENLGYIDKTYTYEYVNGNIKYKHEYDYTTGTLPATPKKTIEYHYDDSSWSDVLTSVSETTYPTTNNSNTSTYSVMGGILNAPSTDTTASDNLAKSLLGNNCKKVDITANGVLDSGSNNLATPNMNTYSINSTTNSSTLFSMEVDEIGNMSKFNGYDFNWNGRRLESISQDGVELISYKYNIDGQRVSKTVGGVTTEYFYNGDILAGQKTGDDVLIFMYDNNGDVFGFEYNGTPYYYIKNAQNDVYMIVDETGVAYVLYMYDAWGRVACYDGTDFGLATINPLMYRSYYIDVETGYFFYYLNSRYYLADLGRFVSSDGQLNEDTLGGNIFAYCSNNPVNRIDPTGKAWGHWILGAAIVAGCAVATVITAGGFGFAMTAFGFAAMGVTVGGATGVCAMATVGSGLAFAACATAAIFNSNSAQDFADQGNWGTVATVATGGFVGGASGYLPNNNSGTSKPNNSSPISNSDARRIQNAANRTHQKITVIGSRAAGTATPTSDWDYIMSGNSAQRHSAASSVPTGSWGGENNFGIDIFSSYPNSPNPVTIDYSKPYIEFYPEF